MKFNAKLASLMTLVSVLVALVSCSEKVNNGDDTTEYNGTYKISFTASKSGGTGSLTNPWTKALVSTTTEGKETVTAEWKAGDIVEVYQQANNPAEAAAHDNKMMWKVGTLTAQSDGVQTTLSGSITGSFTTGNSLLLCFQHADDLIYDFTGQDGTLKTIGSKYDYADFFTSISSIYGDNIVINSGSAYFNSEQSIAKFVLTDQDGAPLKPSKLTLSTSGESDFIQVFEPLEANYSTPSPSNNPFSNFIETGPIEVITSGETNEIYVAVTGNGDGNGTGSGIMYCMDPTTLTIEAVVGNDIYSYTRNEFTFNTNNFYVFNVTMTKKAPATGGN